jgi:hypothetical protein
MNVGTARRTPVAMRAPSHGAMNCEATRPAAKPHKRWLRAACPSSSNSLPIVLGRLRTSRQKASAPTALRYPMTLNASIMPSIQVRPPVRVLSLLVTGLPGGALDPP